MGGGILPVSLHNGKLHFLFGQEVDNRQWGDFGGGREGKETPFQTAIREGCEELDGFLGCESALKKMVTDNLVLQIDTEQLRTNIFAIEYDENLPIYFNNHHKFIQRHVPHKINKKGLFEKSQIRWFTVAELRKRRNTFRPFYRHVIDNILAHQQQILNAMI
jgi:8-oxo-dGTP pyrophosphatase MutT (NUDIX family)